MCKLSTMSTHTYKLTHIYWCGPPVNVELSLVKTGSKSGPYLLVAIVQWWPAPVSVDGLLVGSVCWS